MKSKNIPTVVCKTLMWCRMSHSSISTSVLVGGVIVLFQT